MAQYMISYFGGDQPSSPEEGKKHFAEYQAWLASLGDAAVQPMVPFKTTSTIGPDGVVEKGSSTDMSGFTMIEAATFEEAVEAMKSCPFLKINGRLEVSELMEM